MMKVKCTVLFKTKFANDCLLTIFQNGIAQSCNDVLHPLYPHKIANVNKIGYVILSDVFSFLVHSLKCFNPVLKLNYINWTIMGHELESSFQLKVCHSRLMRYKFYIKQWLDFQSSSRLNAVIWLIYTIPHHILKGIKVVLLKRKSSSI